MTWLVLAAALLAGVWWVLLSRTRGLPEATARILGHLFEIGVYRDVPRQILRCLARLTRAAVSLGARLLAPAALFLMPLVPVLIFLQACLGHRPLLAGESCLVWLKLASPARLDGVQLGLPQGVSVVGDPVRIADRGEIYWRVQAHRPGRYALVAGGVSKLLVVGPGEPWLRLARTKQWYGPILTPGEPNLPVDSPIDEFRVEYPNRIFRIDGRRVPWDVPFLLALVACSAAFSLRKSSL